tara:strand:+ start:712 stop:942 length:231 start_codon:yes stop_codon:yes gene_type:complete
MPIYAVKHKETGVEKDVFLSISAMQDFLAEGEYTQVITAPALVTHTGNIVNKTSSDWKDHLKAIKRNSTDNNTINV